MDKIYCPLECRPVGDGVDQNVGVYFSIATEILYKQKQTRKSLAVSLEMSQNV